MANINLYKSRTWAFLASVHRLPDIKYYMISINFVTLKIYIKVTLHNIRNGAIRWQISDFLSDSNNNIFSTSHHLRNICQKFWPWKWRSRSRSRRTELVLFDWKCSIPYKVNFCRILATWKHAFPQTGYTNSERQVLSKNWIRYRDNNTIFKFWYSIFNPSFIECLTSALCHAIVWIWLQND